MQNHEKSKSILLNDEQKFNIKKNAIFNFKEEINTNNTNTESKEKSISNEKLKNFLKSKEKKSENYDSKIAKSSKNDENFNTNNNDKIFDENNMKNSINSSNPKNKPTTKSLKVFVNDKLIEICDFELKIDPEIEENLDLLSRQKIKSILNKKYVKQVIIKDQFSESSINHETKSLFLFNIFLQVLAEINIKDKEKSFMLYKFFKIYFAQQNKKYGLILSKLNEKVKFYKDLCMLIVQQKHRQIENIEVIAEILSTGKLNEENLTNHKKLIKDLLVINNEKREELYLKNSEIEILTKELRFFIHDFDNIKLDKKIRLNLTDIKKNELESIKKNINNELSHLPMSIDRSLLINADIFMFLSGHRKYFYEQKEYYLREVEKLREKVHLATSDKKTYLEQYNILKYESNKKINDLNEQIREYRENIFKEKKQTSVQTDIDLKEFGKIEHHHFSFVNKKNEVLKISILADYMDTVIYTTRAISNHKSLFQMSITSILNFISEVYENKLINDIDNDLNRKVRMNLDDYLYYYMKSIFQHKDHIKDNMEKFIYSIYNVFSSDVRIYYFSRFTGMLEYKFINQIDFKEQKTDSDNNLNHNSNNNIKENTKGWNTSLITNDFSNIKREVLDAYLMIISSFSFPICKVIDLEIDEYLISVESCVNILNSFKHLNLLNFEFLKMSISSKNSDLYKICKQLNIPLCSQCNYN